MNIKDAYIHGTHGVVKNINVAIKESEPYDDSILYYTLADLNNTSRYVKLPLASDTQNGLMSSLDKIKLNNFSSDIHSSGWYNIQNPYSYNINGDKTIHHHYIKIATIDIMDYVLRFRIFEDINYPSYGEWILRLNHDASNHGKNVTLYQISPSTINLSLYVTNSGDSSNPQYEVWIKSDIEWVSAIQFCIEKNLNNKNLVFTSNWEYSIEKPINIIATLNNSGSIRISTSNGQEVVHNNSNQSTYKSYLTSDFFVGNLRGNSDTSSVTKATAYGVCDTASDDATKVVTIPSNQFGGLVAGSRVSVRFLNANTANKITLQINDSAAKLCNWNGYDINGMLKAYTVYDFIFDGALWRLVGGIDTDTKNTAGSTNSDSKLFLIGATSQSANPQTYSHDTAYVGSDGFLYSNSKKVDMDLVVPLNAQGSAIPANADLNTIEYLKIGNYYCQYTNDAAKIKNCPVSVAFRMEVYSILEIAPSESSAWTTRLRKLTTLIGKQYIQYCYNSNNAEFTYGDWIYIPTVKTVMDLDTNGSVIKVGDSATPVYINTNGNFEACTNVQSDISKAVDASTRITSQEELDAFIEAGKVKFAILGASAELPKPILNGKDGLIVSHGLVDTSNYGYQMAYDDNGYNISFRYYNYGTWSPWKALTFEGHTHNYAGSDSAGGPANEVKITSGSSDVWRNMLVTAGANDIFSVPNVFANYSLGALKSKSLYISGASNNSTGYISSDSTSNMYFGVNGVIPLVIESYSETNNIVRPSTSLPGKVDLGSTSYPWRNVYATTFIGNLDGYYVNKLTGYTETKSDAKITAADTLNAALSKLEHKADLAYKWVSSVTAETDTDEYVNKWDEIVDFLDSVKEGSDITDEFVTRKTEQTITGLKTISSSLFCPLVIERSGSTNTVSLRFKNSHGILGSIGMNTVYGNLIVHNADTTQSKIILDTVNYSNYALPLSGGTMTGSIVSQTIRPTTTNTYNLGSSDYIWKNVYATIFDGALRSKDIRELTGVTSDFSDKAFTPFFSNISMPTDSWWSGFTSKGWTNSYNSWQLVGFSGENEVSTSNLCWRNGKTDTWNNWKKILDNSNTTYTESITKSTLGSYVIGTLKIGGTNHVLYGKDTSPISLSNTIKTNTKYVVSTSSWTNTGYTFESLDAGTYAIQLTSDNLVASGIMSVLKNVTDTMGDEIPLHVYGTAGWRPYLRTRENKLQIASNDVSNTERTVTIKIARIL